MKRGLWWSGASEWVLARRLFHTSVSGIFDVMEKLVLNMCDGKERSNTSPNSWNGSVRELVV